MNEDGTFSDEAILEADHDQLIPGVSATLGWRRARRDADQLVDRVGYPIDGGIKETVAVLRALGIPTSGSCEGHPDRGLAFPWVDVRHPYLFGEHEGTEVNPAIVTANLAVRDRLRSLVEAFYGDAGGEPLDAVRLAPKGIFGATRIRVGPRSIDERGEVHRLAPRQGEMMRFTEFLLDRLRLEAERLTVVASASTTFT